MLRRNFAKIILGCFGIAFGVKNANAKTKSETIFMFGQDIYHAENGKIYMIERSNGNKDWYDENGMLVRYEFTHPSAGRCYCWHKDGKFHRDNGLPAIEYEKGQKFYYENGVFIKDNGMLL